MFVTAEESEYLTYSNSFILRSGFKSLIAGNIDAKPHIKYLGDAMKPCMCLSLPKFKTSRPSNFRVKTGLKVTLREQGAAFITLLKVLRSSCRLGKL